MFMWTNALALFIKGFSSCSEHKTHGFRRGWGSSFLLLPGKRWSRMASTSPKYFLVKCQVPFFCLRGWSWGCWATPCLWIWLRSSQPPALVRTGAPGIQLGAPVLLWQGSLAASGVWDRDALMAVPLPAHPAWEASCSSLTCAARCPPYGKGGKDRGIPVHIGLESGRSMQGAGKWELGNAPSSCSTDRRPGTWNP